MTDGAKPVLVVLKDRAPLPEDEARALWTAFSAHMDAHKGDMAGFAKLKGWVAVAPEYRKGQAVLVVSTTEEAAAKAKAAAPVKPAPAKPSPAKKDGGQQKKAAGKGGSAPKAKKAKR